MGNSSCKECLSELDDPQAGQQFNVLEGISGERGKYALRYKWVDDKLVKVDETASASRNSSLGQKGQNPPFPDYEIMCDGPIDQGGEPRGFTLSLSAIKPDPIEVERNGMMETGEIRDFTGQNPQNYAYGQKGSYGQQQTDPRVFSYNQQASYPPAGPMNGRFKR